MNSKKIIDPNAKSVTKNSIFGLPFEEKDAKVIYLPIPWEVTTSYLGGTALGPQAILKASPQIDLFDLEYGNTYESGLYMQKINPEIKRQGILGRKLAKKIIDATDEEIIKSKILKSNLKKVNTLSEWLNQRIYEECKKLLAKNKIPIIVGGDHSTPFGAIRAYAEKYKGMGILHIDAHSDTRKAYMGFEYSHASIMYNVMEKINDVGRLVQVGIRDFCQEEYQYTQNHDKIYVFYHQKLSERKLLGESFEKVARDIVSKLPELVYISFDIDGLSPQYCPHTGTPVPGGLSFDEAVFLINLITKSNKKIIGFDLVEVAPSVSKKDEWDANVGMRLLYKITGAIHRK